MGIDIDEVHSVVPIKADPFVSERLTVPGIGTAAPYASGDAFGGLLVFEVPRKGTIANVLFFDLDNEAINKELVLFSVKFTETADNSPFDPADFELLSSIGVVFINTWSSFANNGLGQGVPALSYIAPAGRLYGQLVTRGADNIAASNLPAIQMVVV